MSDLEKVVAQMRQYVHKDDTGHECRADGHTLTSWANTIEQNKDIGFEEVIRAIRGWPVTMLAGLFFEVGTSSIRAGVFRDDGGIETCVARCKAYVAKEAADVQTEPKEKT